MNENNDKTKYLTMISNKNNKYYCKFFLTKEKIFKIQIDNNKKNEIKNYYLDLTYEELKKMKIVSFTENIEDIINELYYNIDNQKKYLIEENKYLIFILELPNSSIKNVQFVLKEIQIDNEEKIEIKKNILKLNKNLNNIMNMINDNNDDILTQNYNGLKESLKEINNKLTKKILKFQNYKNDDNLNLNNNQDFKTLEKKSIDYNKNDNIFEELKKENEKIKKELINIKKDLYKNFIKKEENDQFINMTNEMISKLIKDNKNYQNAYQMKFYILEKQFE